MTDGQEVSVFVAKGGQAQGRVYLTIPGSVDARNMERQPDRFAWKGTFVLSEPHWDEE